MSKQAVDILITLLTNGTITEDDVITALNDYKGENKVPFDKLPKITLRSDGRFMMNIPAKHSPTGKRYPVYGSSEEEVKRNYKHTIVIPLAKEPTIEEYMFTVMRAYFYGNMEDTTYDRYENAYYGIVFGSDFGKIKLKETSGLILTNYIKELKKTSISSKSISMIKTLIRKTFLHAKENGLADDNVAEYMVSSNKRHNQSPTKKKYKESFNFLEISKIESVIKNEWNKKRKWRNTTTRKFLYGPMFMIMYHTGLRIGEIMGLRKSRIDWKNKTIYIIEQYAEGWNHDENGKRTTKKYYYKLPKTQSSIRYAILTPEVEYWLKELERRYKVLEIESEFVIANSQGNTPTKSCAYEMWKRILATAGVEYRPPHKLRKTFVTVALNGGMKLPKVSSIVGHKYSTVTLNEYFTAIEEEDSEIQTAKQLHGIFANGWRINDNTFDNSLTTHPYLKKMQKAL